MDPPGRRKSSPVPGDSDVRARRPMPVSYAGAGDERSAVSTAVVAAGGRSRVRGRRRSTRCGQTFIERQTLRTRIRALFCYRVAAVGPAARDIARYFPNDGLFPSSSSSLLQKASRRDGLPAGRSAASRQIQPGLARPTLWHRAPFRPLTGQTLTARKMSSFFRTDFPRSTDPRRA